MKRVVASGLLLLVLAAGAAPCLPAPCCAIKADYSVQTLSYSAFARNPGDLWHQVESLAFWAIPLTPPQTYYDTAIGLTGEALRSELHELIDEHLVCPYNDSVSRSAAPRIGDLSVDTWDILASANASPEGVDKVVAIYSNRSLPRQFVGSQSGDVYDREHSWPKSYGFKSHEDEIANPAFSDCHHLFPALRRYNQSRGQCPYGSPNGENGAERETTFALGCGGTEGEANTRFSSASVAGGSCLWETWCGRRGDIARAMFYMAVRYEGEVLALDYAGSIVHEPDLTLVNDLSLVRTRNDAWEAGSAAFMGLLDVLLQWHAEDPPDDFERRRNTVVYLFQRNRNPFIDHPEWVEAIFGTPSV